MQIYKEIYAKRDAKKAQTLSIGEVHHALEREFAQQGRFGTPDPTHFTQPRMCKFSFTFICQLSLQRKFN